MPELVNSRVGSLPGTSGADGTMVWPLPLKNSRKSLRMRAVVYGVVGVIWLRLADGSGRHAPDAPGRTGNQPVKGIRARPPTGETGAVRPSRHGRREAEPGSRSQSSGSQRVAARMASPSN